jgi:hypothetical protein
VKLDAQGAVEAHRAPQRRLARKLERLAWPMDASAEVVERPEDDWE